jgi:16S rRNA (uracil1498-N3)-methyltransferase
MIRIAVEPSQRTGDSVRLTPDQARYLGRVMRRQVGDPVEVLVGGRAYAAVVDGDDTLMLLEPVAEHAEPAVAVALLQALLKGDRVAGAVDRAVQAGAHAIWPVTTARAIVRTASRDRLARWRAVATEATEQSGRIAVPSVAEVSTLSEVAAPRPVIALVPGADPLPAVWRRLGRPSPVSVLVGPEGGLTAQEAECADAAAGLGNRVVRAENAGAFAVFWLLASVWQETAGEPKSC